MASTITGQSAGVFAMTDHEGHTFWMSTDGRVWNGRLPMNGDHFGATFSGHMSEGAHFPDGTSHGATAMTIDRHSLAGTAGRYSGNGDAGSFTMTASPMWNRAASLDTVAGVYTRSTSSGYSMTMAISTNGQVTGSDSRGCVFDGAMTVTDVRHNLYHVEAHVSSCGSLDGHYQGMGALLDADAMQDWMTAMHPLEHGGHSHGGPMMGGSHMGGHNTVPAGQQNLFVFCVTNDGAAVMDALAR